MTRSDHRDSEGRREFLKVGAYALAGMLFFGCAEVKDEWREKVEGKGKKKKPEPRPVYSAKVSIADDATILAATKATLDQLNVQRVKPENRLITTKTGDFVTHINGQPGYYVYEIDGNHMNTAANSVDKDQVGSASRITWFHIYDLGKGKKQPVLIISR